MTKKQIYPQLDSLKGLFILIIVLHNASLVNPLLLDIPGVPYIYHFGGAFGNSMFFLLSGFLLSTNYRDKIASGGISIQDYLHGRLRKLYPTYLITNAVAVLIEIGRYGASGLRLEKLAFTLLLQNGSLSAEGPYNAPTWFVSALFVCYGVYYLICRVARSQVYYQCGLALFIIWGYSLQIFDVSVPYCYAGNGTAFVNFFIGCALAECLPKIKAEHHKWLRPAVFLSLIGIGYLCLNYGVEIICGNVDSAAAFVVSPMIVYLAMSDGLCAGFLRAKPLVSLGKASFSVFFWHLPLLYVMQDLLASGGELGLPLFAGYLVCLLLWSFAYNCLQKRFL